MKAPAAQTKWEYGCSSAGSSGATNFLPASYVANCRQGPRNSDKGRETPERGKGAGPDDGGGFGGDDG
jgi:hypothetical protein